jgi:glycosyltransferase involved in cell wall biosynthesis
MTPRRALMTADAVGGVLTYATTLATELASRGVQVHLALLGPPPRPEQRVTLRAIPGLVLHELDCALEWMDDPWADVARSSEWLLDLEQRVKPDVVHVNGYAHAAAGFRAPVVLVAHSCVVSWWRAALGEEAPARYDTYRREVKRGLLRADAVIAPSRAMLHCLARDYAFERGLVVSNGARVPMRMRPKEPFVLSCGRIWDRAKNVATVARVGKRLAWPVKLAGSGAEQEEFENVEHLGWLDHDALGEVMERASICALPGLYEPFGLCALEAALRSCALVLGDIESQREIWDDAALFVDPRDDDRVAYVLSTLVEDQALRAEMSERAWRRALAYSPARMADGTLAVYASVIAARAEGAVQCAS